MVLASNVVLSCVAVLVLVLFSSFGGLVTNLLRFTNCFFDLESWLKAPVNFLRIFFLCRNPNFGLKFLLNDKLGFSEIVVEASFVLVSSVITEFVLVSSSVVIL